MKYWVMSEHKICFGASLIQTILLWACKKKPKEVWALVCGPPQVWACSQNQGFFWKPSPITLMLKSCVNILLGWGSALNTYFAMTLKHWTILMFWPTISHLCVVLPASSHHPVEKINTLDHATLHFMLQLVGNPKFSFVLYSLVYLMWLI